MFKLERFVIIISFYFLQAQEKTNTEHMVYSLAHMNKLDEETKKGKLAKRKNGVFHALPSVFDQ